jgi:hypothetical protein
LQHEEANSSDLRWKTYPVFMHEGPEPFALRSGMAFTNAVFDGSVEPVGMCSAFSKVGHMGESSQILA